jgi:hypothetical protein
LEREFIVFDFTRFGAQDVTTPAFKHSIFVLEKCWILVSAVVKLLTHLISAVVALARAPDISCQYYRQYSTRIHDVMEFKIINE